MDLTFCLRCVRECPNHHRGGCLYIHLSCILSRLQYCIRCEVISFSIRRKGITPNQPCSTLWTIEHPEARNNSKSTLHHPLKAKSEIWAWCLFRHNITYCEIQNQIEEGLAPSDYLTIGTHSYCSTRGVHTIFNGARDQLSFYLW